jgi:hypothetical protein
VTCDVHWHVGMYVHTYVHTAGPNVRFLHHGLLLFFPSLFSPNILQKKNIKIFQSHSGHCFFAFFTKKMFLFFSVVSKMILLSLGFHKQIVTETLLHKIDFVGARGQFFKGGLGGNFDPRQTPCLGANFI